MEFHFCSERSNKTGRLEGIVAIITEAASGMGLSAVELFTKEGAKVVATHITTERLAERIGKITD